MHRFSLHIRVGILIGLFIIVALPLATVYAQPFQSTSRFVPLAGIPGFTDQSYTLPSLFNTLYRLAIVAGALIAVIKITVAGVKYMGTDSIGSKGEAKEDIKNALLGLLILLSAVLILRTIIGDIKLDVLKIDNSNPYNTSFTGQTQVSPAGNTQSPVANCSVQCGTGHMLNTANCTCQPIQVQ